MFPEMYSGIMWSKMTSFSVAVVVATATLFYAQIYAPPHLRPLTSHLLNYPHNIPTITDPKNQNIPRIIQRSARRPPPSFYQQLRSLLSSPQIAIVKVKDLPEADGGEVVSKPKVPKKVKTVEEIQEEVYEEKNGSEDFRYGYQVQADQTYVDHSNGQLCDDGLGTVSGTYCASNGKRYNVNLESTNQAAAEFNQAVADKIVALDSDEIVEIAKTEGIVTGSCNSTDLACHQKQLETSVTAVVDKAILGNNVTLTQNVTNAYLNNQKANDYISLTAEQIEQKYGTTNINDLIAGLNPEDQAKVKADRQKNALLLSSAKTSTTERLVNGKPVYTLTTTYVDPATGEILKTDSLTYTAEVSTTKEKTDNGFITHDTVVFRDNKTGAILDAKTTSYILKSSTKTYTVASRNDGDITSKVSVTTTTATDANTGAVIRTVRDIVEGEITSPTLSYTQLDTSYSNSTKPTTTSTRTTILNPNYTPPQSTPSLPTNPFGASAGESCEADLDCMSGSCSRNSVVQVKGICDPTTTTSALAAPESCSPDTTLVCRGNACACLSQQQANSLSTLESASQGSLVSLAESIPENYSSKNDASAFDSYAVANGNQTINKILTYANTGLSLLPSWERYRDAYVNDPEKHGLYWIEHGYDSLADCQQNAKVYLATVLCGSQVAASQDQLSASVDFGTDLTSIGAGIGSLPGLAKVGGNVILNTALKSAVTGAKVSLLSTGTKALLPALSTFGVVSTFHQTGNATSSCLDGSDTCTTELGYAGLSWANLGTMQFVSSAFSSGSNLAINQARILNTVVTTANASFDSGYAYTNCVGEYANLPGCAGAIVTVAFDVGGGILDYNTGQLIFKKVSDVKITPSTLLALADTSPSIPKDTSTTPIQPPVSLSRLLDLGEVATLPIHPIDLGRSVPSYRLDLDSLDITLKPEAERFNNLLDRYEASTGRVLYQEQVAELTSQKPILQLKRQDGTSLAGKTSVFAPILSVSEPRTFVLTKTETELNEVINAMLEENSKGFYKAQNTHAIYIDSSGQFLEINFDAPHFDKSTARRITAQEVSLLLESSQASPDNMRLIFLGDRASAVWTRLRGNESPNTSWIKSILGETNTTQEGQLLQKISQAQYGKFLVVADEISDDIRQNLAISDLGQPLKQVRDPKLLGGLTSGQQALDTFSDVRHSPSLAALVEARLQELSSGLGSSARLKKVGAHFVPSDLHNHANSLSEIIIQALKIRKSRSKTTSQILTDLSIKLTNPDLAAQAIKELEAFLSQADYADPLIQNLAFRKNSLQDSWDQLGKVPGTNFGQEADNLVLRNQGSTTKERLSSPTQLLSFYDLGPEMLLAYRDHMLPGETINPTLLPKLDDILIAPRGTQMSVLDFYQEFQSADHLIRGLDATPQVALNLLNLPNSVTAQKLRPAHLALSSDHQSTYDLFIQRRKTAHPGKASAVVLAAGNVDMEADIQGILSAAHRNKADYSTVIIAQYQQSPDGKTVEEYLSYRVSPEGKLLFEERSILESDKKWNEAIATALESNPEQTLIVFKGRERGANLVVGPNHNKITWSHFFDTTGGYHPDIVSGEQMGRRDRTFNFDQHEMYFVTTTHPDLTADNVNDYFTNNLYLSLSTDRLEQTLKYLADSPTLALTKLDTLASTLELSWLKKQQLSALKKQLEAESSSFAAFLESSVSREALSRDELLSEVYTRAVTTNRKILDLVEKISGSISLTPNQLQTLKSELGATDSFLDRDEYWRLLSEETSSLTPPTKTKVTGLISPQEALISFAKNNSLNTNSAAQYRAPESYYLASSHPPTRTNPSTASTITPLANSSPARPPQGDTTVGSSIAHLIDTTTNSLALAFNQLSATTNSYDLISLTYGITETLKQAIESEPTVTLSKPSLNDTPLTSVLSNPDFRALVAETSNSQIELSNSPHGLLASIKHREPILLDSPETAVEILPHSANLINLSLDNLSVSSTQYHTPLAAATGRPEFWNLKNLPKMRGIDLTSGRRSAGNYVKTIIFQNTTWNILNGIIFDLKLGKITYAIAINKIAKLPIHPGIKNSFIADLTATFIPEAPTPKPTPLDPTPTNPNPASSNPTKQEKALFALLSEENLEKDVYPVANISASHIKDPHEIDSSRLLRLAISKDKSQLVLINPHDYELPLMINGQTVFMASDSQLTLNPGDHIQLGYLDLTYNGLTVRIDSIAEINLTLTPPTIGPIDIAAEVAKLKELGNIDSILKLRANRYSATANITTFTKKLLDAVPPIKLSDLITQVIRLATQYQLSDDEIARIVQSLAKFDQRRTETQAMLEGANSDPRELYRLTTGAYPRGHVELVRGVISFALIIHDKYDYAYAYDSSPDRIEQTNNKPYVSTSRANALIKEASGFYSPETNTSFVYADDLKKLFKPNAIKSTLYHEYQHAINYIFMPNLIREPWARTASANSIKLESLQRLAEQQIQESPTIEAKKQALLRYARSLADIRRHESELHLANEFVAQVSGIYQYTGKNESKLTLPSYLPSFTNILIDSSMASLRNHYAFIANAASLDGEIIETSLKLVAKGSYLTLSDQEIEALVKQVEAEYYSPQRERLIVNQAHLAYKKLLHKGYSHFEALVLLSSSRISEWGSVARSATTRKTPYQALRPLTHYDPVQKSIEYGLQLAKLIPPDLDTLTTRQMVQRSPLVSPINFAIDLTRLRHGDLSIIQHLKLGNNIVISSTQKSSRLKSGLSIYMDGDYYYVHLPGQDLQSKSINIVHNLFPTASMLDSGDYLVTVYARDGSVIGEPTDLATLIIESSKNQSTNSSPPKVAEEQSSSQDQSPVALLDGRRLDKLLQDEQLNLVFITDESDNGYQHIFMKVAGKLYYYQNSESPQEISLEEALKLLPVPASIIHIELNDRDVTKTYSFSPEKSVLQTVVEALRPSPTPDPSWKTGLITNARQFAQSSAAGSTTIPSIVLKNSHDGKNVILLLGANTPPQTLISIKRKNGSKTLGTIENVTLPYKDHSANLSPGDIITFGDTQIEILDQSRESQFPQHNIRWTTIISDRENNLHYQLSQLYKLRYQSQSSTQSKPEGIVATLNRREFTAAVNSFETSVQQRYRDLNTLYQQISNILSGEQKDHEAILDLVLIEAQKLSFTKAEINNILYATNTYLQQRKRVGELIAEYGDSEQGVKLLWKNAFGFEPTARIQIYYHENQITLIPDSLEDFARSYNSDEDTPINNVPLDPVVINEVIKRVGGFHKNNSSRIKNTENIFNISRNDLSENQVIIHEQQHGLFSVLQLAISPNIITPTYLSRQQDRLSSIVRYDVDSIKARIYQDIATLQVRFPNLSSPELAQVHTAIAENKTTFLISKLDHPNTIIYLDPESDTYTVYSGENLSDFVDSVSQFLHDARLPFETMVANEILAQIADRQSLGMEINNIVSDTNSDLGSSSYSFFESGLPSIIEKIKKLNQATISRSFLGITLDPLGNYLIDKLYSPESQASMVSAATKAYKTLLAKGWSHASASLILQSTRLAHWPSVANRATIINPLTSTPNDIDYNKKLSLHLNGKDGKDSKILSINNSKHLRDVINQHFQAGRNLTITRRDGTSTQFLSPPHSIIIEYIDVHGNTKFAAYDSPPSILAPLLNYNTPRNSDKYLERDINFAEPITLIDGGNPNSLTTRIFEDAHQLSLAVDEYAKQIQEKGSTDYTPIYLIFTNSLGLREVIHPYGRSEKSPLVISTNTPTQPQATYPTTLWNSQTLTQNAERMMAQLRDEAHRQGMSDESIDYQLELYSHYFSKVPMVTLKDKNALRSVLEGKDLLSAKRLGKNNINTHTGESDIELGLDNYVFGTWGYPDGGPQNSIYGDYLMIVDPAIMNNPNTIVTIGDRIRIKGDKDAYKNSAMRGSDFVKMMTLSAIVSHTNPLEFLSGNILPDKEMSPEIEQMTTRWIRNAEIKVQDNISNDAISAVAYKDHLESEIEDLYVQYSANLPKYSIDILSNHATSSNKVLYEFTRLAWNLRRIAINPASPQLLFEEQHDSLIYSYQHKLPTDLDYPVDLQVKFNKQVIQYTLDDEIALNRVINEVLVENPKVMLFKAQISTSQTSHQIVIRRPTLDQILRQTRLSAASLITNNLAAPVHKNAPQLTLNLPQPLASSILIQRLDQLVYMTTQLKTYNLPAITFVGHDGKRQSYSLLNLSELEAEIKKIREQISLSQLDQQTPPGTTLQHGRYIYDPDQGRATKTTQVYRAWDNTLHRFVYIKTATKLEYSEIIKHESAILRELPPTEFLPLFIDSFEIDGKPYLVLNEMPGPTLKEYHRNRQLAGHPLTPTEVHNIITQVANQLDLNHAKKIIHRDLKPENIIITPTGPILIDYGISESERIKLPEVVEASHSLKYASPSQLIGSKSTPLTDLRALMVITHNLLTGSLPFVGDDDTLFEHILENRWDTTAKKSWRRLFRSEESKQEATFIMSDVFAEKPEILSEFPTATKLTAKIFSLLQENHPSSPQSHSPMLLAPLGIGLGNSAAQALIQSLGVGILPDLPLLIYNAKGWIENFGQITSFFPDLTRIWHRARQFVLGLTTLIQTINPLPSPGSSEIRQDSFIPGTTETLAISPLTNNLTIYLTNESPLKQSPDGRLISENDTKLIKRNQRERVVLEQSLETTNIGPFLPIEAALNPLISPKLACHTGSSISPKTSALSGIFTPKFAAHFMAASALAAANLSREPNLSSTSSTSLLTTINTDKLLGSNNPTHL